MNVDVPRPEAPNARSLVAVIRASGERTAEICHSVLSAQLAGTPIRVVREQPFEAALRACYQHGIESGAEWMLTVDADVIPRDGGVQELLRAAQALPARFAQIEGVIHDKLRGDYREAGHRMYRTRWLPLALAAIPEPGTVIRPEFETLERLAREGHPSRKTGVVFGIHDYEQYLRDIYRKAFVHGQKHPHWLWEVVPSWKAASGADADFRVAVRGFVDGAQADVAARIDGRMYYERAAAVLAELGLEEKPELPATAGAIEGVRELSQRLLSVMPQPRSLGRGARIATAYRELGAVRLVPYLVGKFLQDAGNRIRRLANRD